MPKSARLLIAVAVALCAAAAGFHASTALAPERLHSEVEGWLERATRSPAEVATLRLVLGFPIRLEGSGLRLYGGALTVERASARHGGGIRQREGGELERRRQRAVWRDAV